MRMRLRFIGALGHHFRISPSVVLLRLGACTLLSSISRFLVQVAQARRLILEVIISGDHRVITA